MDATYITRCNYDLSISDSAGSVHLSPYFIPAQIPRFVNSLSHPQGLRIHWVKHRNVFRRTQDNVHKFERNLQKKTFCKKKIARTYDFFVLIFLENWHVLISPKYWQGICFIKNIANFIIDKLTIWLATNSGKNYLLENFEI